ncbi:thialysine N-epsilon-acetyltransferase-like [Sphaerodactylus townsendi]|uniref:thialysine N-epsilon-acetyltransferase-like n=1 Tax=Sphaerodactylus townsendi TaxID=933632 RepID=UPI00202726D7|nr:thialysine N-epsilon-acetyltransferase-like [Sphaerodactylus townsendi]
MECVIRPAASEDCDHIMALIREIAEFHHLLDEVTINSQVLKADGFGEDPFFKCILAELPAETGKPVKPPLAASYFFGYCFNRGRSVYLENLYVVPEFRGKGIGTKLLGQVAEAALAAGCVEMHALMTMDWNSPAKGFYLNLGAQDLTQSEERHCMELDREALQRLAQRGKHSSRGALGPSSGQAQKPEP